MKKIMMIMFAALIITFVFLWCSLLEAAEIQKGKVYLTSKGTVVCSSYQDIDLIGNALTAGDADRVFVRLNAEERCIIADENREVIVQEHFKRDRIVAIRQIGKTIPVYGFDFQLKERR